MQFSDINWSDYKSPLSDHFTVGESLFLPSWGVYHNPSDTQKLNIYNTAQKMEQIREFLGNNSINITCWVRPMIVSCNNDKYSGRNYNLFVGGAVNSAHCKGLAVDFTVSTITCNDVRYLLVPELTNFDIYMENKLNAGWVHINLPDGVPRKNRYFVP